MSSTFNETYLRELELRMQAVGLDAAHLYRPRKARTPDPSLPQTHTITSSQKAFLNTVFDNELTYVTNGCEDIRHDVLLRPLRLCW